ncbi:protein bassoon isoform X1 [Pangasianodon hypophthalmus]|uniref:protein bassoon isoform X1 n=1 Tax=Pangasianodon hypophthalmus TaxID=310915 RepID=UPI0023082015|nr:protein bassoon isoform X1 [Pangasianodon hypophthalmus]
MGNEASLEGESGQPGAASASAPPRAGQLSEPSTGARAAPGPGPNSTQGKPTHTDPSNGPKPGGSVGGGPDQSQSPRKSPQGDAGGPKSPYSVPQIAPMPSSKLCPVCKTADLTGVTDGQPNCNTCTQCRATVCNQCGFNPNPHLTEVQEWLCLNCQMQRALGMDMDTPRSKSQQQIHSPQQPTKAQPRTAPQTPSSTQPKPFPPSQNEPKSQSQPSTPLKTQTQTQAKPQPQPTPSTQSQGKPQPQPTPSTQSQAKPQSQPSPSTQSQAKPQSQPSPSTQTQAKPQPQTTPSAQTQAKPQSQPPTPSQTQPKLPSTPQTQRKSQSQPATPTKSQPNPPPSEQPFGKLFGFGASLLNQASSLISVDQPQPQSQPQTPQKAPTPTPKPGAQPGPPPGPQPGAPSQQQKSRPKVCCLLCKTELNVGVPTEPPNYNHCTQCHSQVCNMCGFNPTPHLTEKKEWLCLTCQTQRAISGDLGDGPSPVPQPMGSPRVPGPSTQQQAQLRPPSQQAGVRHAGPQQQKTPGAQVSGPLPSTKQGTPQSKGPTQVSPAKTAPTQPASKSKAETRKQEQGISKKQAVSKTEKEGDMKVFLKKGTQEVKDQKKCSDSQKSKHHDDSNKSSTQSLSDTGYSSDGISGSQSEITGLIREEGIKLSEGGLSTQRSPPSPSEIKKLESSMRPLLQSETASEIDKQRPQSLTITQDQFDSDGEVSDDLSCKLRHDYVEDSSESGLSPLPTRQKLQKDLTDEEFMRRQILEMSADEEEMVETEGQVKIKKSHKHSGDLGKERRRLTQQSNSFEDDTKSNDGAYKSSDTDEMMGSQGGLRRFKTIELNNTNSYNRDLELSTEHDLREPELEMESLTGSPEERSRGEYSSTLPATTPSYTSGTSPTSVSSLEDDSDSSPSRRQRLEEVKQQRKARHRSHGPLLPTIEDSSEEDELREEEELLREQEKMRDLEQQRIRSTARKTKRDKEELRAQRRRERSKTPPSNLSPIEDASPTEELRQAAEMEELHRSSCSEYSPSMDSEAEGFEVGSKLYKSGSEYNLPNFMSLYSPTEKTSAVSPSAVHKSLKSAEEVYEEMMRKAEMMQKQQGQPGKQGQQGASHLANNQHLRTGSTSLSPGTSPTQMSAPVSFSESSTSGKETASLNDTQQNQAKIPTQTSKISQSQPQVRQPDPGQQQVRPVQGQGADSTTLTSKLYAPFKGPSPTTSPSSSPTQSPTPAKAHGHTSSVPSTPQGSPIPQRTGAPRLARQQSSQDTPVMVITLGSGTTTQPPKPITVNSSTSPLSSPTSSQQQPIFRTQAPVTSSPTSPQMSQLTYQRGQAAERVTTGSSTPSCAVSQSQRSENISVCKISNVPGTSKVIEQGTVTQSGNVVDLRAVKPAPIIMTDHGMDLTSVSSDTRRYSVDADHPPSRHTAVQPLIMNLNAQAQPYVTTSTPTTVSVTVAASMFISQPKHPMVYGDPLQNRVDFGQGAGSAVCLSQPRPPITDPSIPKIDACLEDLGIQQQQLQKQQQKLQQQQELLEQQLQQHQQNTASFARYNLANQVQPILLKKDLVVCQTSGGTTQTVVSAIPKVSPLPPQPLTSSVSPTPTIGHDIYGGVALELKNKPTVANLSTGKPHVMMVQLDESSSSQGGTVTQIVKKEEPPPAPEVLDLTGQIKSENQVACCDVVYQLPFAGSCSGPFGQRGKTAISEPNPSADSTPAPHQQTQLEKDGYQPVNMQGVSEEHKPFTMPPPGRLPPSMSDTNLAESGLQYYQRTDPGDLAVDLSSMKQAYEAGYLGMGAQYGSYTDLRHQGDVSTPPLPLRRYGSLSNISGDFGYHSRDLAGAQEPNLAQYSATTAREISRMCAALNSMDQFGNRYTNSPDLLQYGAGRGGPLGRLGLQQGLTSLRANLLYGPDGRPTAHGQALTNLINARQASLRALYPPALRTADGMIYSTINTPIASTLPITTQPAPVLNSMLRGVYRPYPPGSVTAVPLASLSRLPHVTPRMPLSTQGPYRYPAPTHFPATAPDSISGSVPTTSTSQETPVYFGRPTVPGTITSTTTSAIPPQPTILNQQTSQGHIPADATTVLPPSQSQIQQQIQAQTQTQALTKSKDLSYTQGLSLSQTQAHLSVPQSQPHAATRVLPDTAVSGIIDTSTDKEKEKEEDRLRQQQEQLLQLERERIELEKLRQLRLQEELERDRLELQRHREKEQLLVQREIQELQNIKQQVLQQQQVERETQLVIQREQLAQQRMQLDQIQALQQQLQLQLEEQKRQKTAAVEAVAAVAAAEAAAASAAAAAAATTAQGAINGMVVGGAPQAISIICDQSGRVIPQDGQSLQFLPCMDGQMVQALVSTRPMPSSASEMSLRNSDDQGSSHIIKKQNSMPRLRNGTEEEPVKRIADSSVQTDDEDAEDRFMSRRRRTRRIADCSVQTDEEDQGEWDSQPVRRRRSRYSKHSESSAESKIDASKVTSSIAIQTTSDSSCQTESDQLGRVSPAIHITMAETSKVELLHYISAPERTHKGESLACQTDPEAQSQGVVVPQLSVPTTVSPYSTSLQVVGATSAKFERRKPDPLDIGLQAQQQIDTRPPKSPQVLYSPVSPLSPHRMLETTFASSEKLNRAHVTPQQKAFTTESPKKHQTIPRPIKSVQRSMSDPKPLSPTSEDPSKTKFSLYQSQNSSGSQLQNSMMRKVKRTLPSPPPDETPLPIVTPAMTHMYSSPGMPQRVLPRPVQGVTKAGLLSELKAVEQESSKLRKQQAELEEEEKEIDAKLRCLELGITQRKETMVKERERRELAYLRGIGDARDYMSDSELNNLRLTGVPAGTYEVNGLLSRPSTAPLSQFTSDPNVTSQYPPTSSYVPYPFPQSQPAPTQPPTAAYQQIGFQAPQYPTPSQPQPGTFQPHPSQPSSYQTQGAYQSHGYAQSYQPDLGLQQPSHQSFQPPAAHLPGQTLPYPGQSLPFQPQADILSGHQLPRHTSLADLEQKLPTNYEIITNPAVSVATSAQETGFSGAYSSPLTNAYGPYRTPDQTMTDRIPSPTSGYGTDGLYTTNLEQNIPRNYVMIDDISELTKENMGSSDASRTGYGSENGPRGMGYGDGSEELYGRAGSTTSYHHQGAVDSHGRPSTTVSGGSSYYYDDYKHSSRSSSGMGSQKHSSKNVAPAAVSSKRSKHRKQGMEQKISKFSPIEEARDVESDLASYTMTTPSGGSCTMVSRSGVKKNVYDQQKYYGSREGLDEDDRLYSSGRSRSTGYGMDKISSRDSGGYRSKSYERDAMERSQRGTHSRSGRSTMRTQNSEEESPLSPVGKPVGMGRVSDPHDVRNQYGSSHSLPDVQDHHTRDMPKSHAYKPDDPYLVDDMHCAVSDSEAYHLGQEETDWFEKPREATSDRSRHHGSGSHSSSGKRGHVKHTYHDYDEPPEEDLWPQDEYSHQRHSSSTSSREHRHHVSSSGRHSSSRHSSEESRSSRSSRSHPKDPSARSEGRSTSSTSHKRSSEPRSSQSGYRDSGEYSRDPVSGHHHSSSGQRGQRQSGASRRQDSPSSKQQQQQQPQQGSVGQQQQGSVGQQQQGSVGQQQQGSIGQQLPPQQGQQRSTIQPTAGRQPGSQQPETGQQGQQTSQQPRTQQQQSQPQPAQQPATTTAGVTQPTAVATGIGAGAAQQQQAKPGQAPASGQPLAAAATTAQPTTAGGGQTKPDAAPVAPTPAVAIGSKAAPQPAKAPMTPATGIGSKAAPRPGGIGSAAQPTQQPMESENVFSKILPGGAAEQAGKLGDAVSAIGKKFTSFW